jgi:hypothetical protein
VRHRSDGESREQYEADRRDAIGLRFALRSRGEEKKAAEYRSGGRKIKRTRSGGSLISGTTGIRPNASPPRTRTG